jgi:hypothetical protein
VLAELAAANAAYAVIKECIANSGEIVSAGKALFEWFDAKSSLQKKVEEKPPDQRSDLEEFFALEELKRQQQELRELMILQGRPGLWDDWLQFQVDARKRRESAAREEQARLLVKRKKIQDFMEKALLAFWLAVLAVVVTGMVVGAAWLYTMKGRF